MHVYVFSTQKEKTKNILNYLFLSSDTKEVTAIVDKNNIYLYVYLQQLKLDYPNLNIHTIDKFDAYTPFLLSLTSNHKRFYSIKDTVEGDSLAVIDSEFIVIPNIVNCPFIIPYHQTWGSIPLGFANTWANSSLSAIKNPEDYQYLWNDYNSNTSEFYSIPSFYVRAKDFYVPAAIGWDRKLNDYLMSEMKSGSVNSNVNQMLLYLCKNQSVKVSGTNVCFDTEGVVNG